MARGLEEHNPQQLADFAKAEAQRLGFTLAGITTADPPPHLDVYEKWLLEGRQGEMAYLETGRALRCRADPTEILPECESILVLGANYLPRRLRQGAIAAYAVGDDYHDVLTQRLKVLVSLLEDHIGREIKHRYYTDTGPLLERELAQRAGLGWIGKNTCLISPDHGSYFFLAELLLDVPMVPDQSIVTDHCGDCTLCIEACPTGCILPDRTIDAQRCISYLTIELKGTIPAELRSLTGEWVFGCDICQQVCPWNIRFAQHTPDTLFQSRPFLESAAARDFLKLTPTDYRKQLKNSPLKRAKLKGLLRNAALAAANSHDRASIPHLARILAEDPEPLPRAHAAWALGQFGEVELLQASLENEQDEGVRDEIRAAAGPVAR